MIHTDTQRTIIHLDLDAFFCAVEEQRDPALRGLPFAVGGTPERRGVVASCSYPARAFGVRSAMPMARAVTLCPDLVVVSPHFADYRAASVQVMERLHALTPLVEQLSIDEAFLDVSDLAPSGDVLARQLQTTIADELGLPCSLGVATNKLVAKIANGVGKRQAHTEGTGYPNALCVVPPGEEAAFLAPLPAATLWGVGPKTAERLAALGIHTIGDLAASPEDDLVQRFGKHGADLARHARGIDERPVMTSRERKSISKEQTFARDVRDAARLRQTIREQAAAVAAALQRKQVRGTTVKLKLRWADLTTLTRQATLPRATDEAAPIAAAALRLLDQAWDGQRAVRLVGVGVSGFGERYVQLPLWEDDEEQAPHHPTS
jgi:DNA polymerase-4